MCCFLCKQKTSYDVRISDWISEECSADLLSVSSSAATSPGLKNWRRTASSEEAMAVMWRFALLPCSINMPRNVFPLLATMELAKADPPGEPSRARNITTRRLQARNHQHSRMTWIGKASALD